jgi:hypothetical protein
VTIYNGVWHSTRPSREDYNLLGPERLSIHDYDIPPEGTLIQTAEAQTELEPQVEDTKPE